MSARARVALEEVLTHRWLRLLRMQLSSEQIGQLFELLKATKEIWVNDDEDGSKDSKETT